MRYALVTTQAFTFIALGTLYMTEGAWRFGAAQLCLAAVTAFVYL